MPQSVPKPGEFRVSDLSTRHATTFDLQPSAPEREALAQQLNLIGIKKLRFEGRVEPTGAKGWSLTAKLGATVVQPCVVTLDPVTTRIDEPVERVYLPAEFLEIEDEAGAETEMPEDTSSEILGQTISAYDAMIESLVLALPLYPRAGDAELGEAVFTEEGVAPLRDEDTKPFAGLAGLRDQLGKKD